MAHRNWLGLALILAAVLVVAGCGRYKEELETAKQRVEQLTSETKQLKQTMGLLEGKEAKVKNDLQRLDEECSKLRAESKKLTEKNGRLLEETKTLQDANEQLKKQVAALERENKDLTRKVEDFKTKQSVQETQQPTRPEQPRPAETRSGVETGKEKVAGTPCEALIQFMRKAGNVVRRVRGEERNRLLQQLEKEYSVQTKGAPKEAINAAKKWVDALNKGWDKTSGDSVFQILVHRNRALKACGKTAMEAGF